MAVAMAVAVAVAVAATTTIDSKSTTDVTGMIKENV